MDASPGQHPAISPPPSSSVGLLWRRPGWWVALGRFYLPALVVGVAACVLLGHAAHPILAARDNPSWGLVVALMNGIAASMVITSLGDAQKGAAMRAAAWPRLREGAGRAALFGLKFYGLLGACLGTIGLGLAALWSTKLQHHVDRAAASTSTAAGLGVFLLLGVVGIFLAIGWLGIRLSLALTLAVLDGDGLRATLRRAFGLSRGHAPSLFWIIFVNGLPSQALLLLLIASRASDVVAPPGEGLGLLTSVVAVVTSASMTTDLAAFYLERITGRRLGPF